MNGYFQLEIKDKGVFMHFIPPTGEGSSCSFSDVTTYLAHLQITGYDAVELNRALSGNTKKTLFISNDTIPIVGEEIFIEISDDKMTAKAKFYPPCVGGVKLDKKDILVTLEAHGIKYGIKEDVIDAFLENRDYCKEFVIAQGIQPKSGTDAKIEYFFNTELRAKPQLNEDGTVDFHKLNTISHVSKGAVLATLTPEKKGRPGRNVLGINLPAKDVKKKKLSVGKNISFSEDGLSAISEVDGHATLVGDQIFVSNTYEVAADVDSSTGDIDYNGNIDVKGTVRAGFMLKAEGNITVSGVVEGATLIAEGDIIVACGIQGMGRGMLKAKGNIVTKFIENATVKAGGNITTEAILHSSVTARNSIMVTGKKGFVTGGKVVAFAQIEAKTIGSTMGAETLISVGIDPEEKELEQKYQKDMAQMQKAIAQLEPVVKKFMSLLKTRSQTSPEKLKQMHEMVGQYRAYKMQYEDRETKLMELYEHQEICKDSRICVHGKIYPGVKIGISESMYVVKGVSQHCQFRREGLDIKMTGL